MRAYFRTFTGAAALALMACGEPAPGEPEEQPDPPLEEQNNPEEAPVEEEAMTEAEMRAAFEKRAEENLAASQKFLDENAQNEGVRVTDSGLQYKVLEEGPKDGVTPVSTDFVIVHYVGTTKDGIEFDSSRARGAAATFPLNQVIPGWTEGVQLMSEGDVYRFFIPPGLAYGATGTPGGPIGPNEALIFDVELIKVKNAEINLAEANKFLAENAKKEGVTTTKSGLQYEVLNEGASDGAQAGEADTVKIHYTGKLVNGTEFASSYMSNTPAEFALSDVEDKWTKEALALMSEGDKYRFYIPPDLAYGEVGTPGGPIGPNEAIIFDVELVEVK